MNVYEAILKRRSIRKFQPKEVPMEALKRVVNAGRVAPTGSNMQPIKFCVVTEEGLRKEIFPLTKWAGYITPAGNPGPGEEPMGYIVLLCDKEIKKAGWDTDAGAVAENILIACVEEGLGTCWLGAIDREKIKEVLNISDRYEIHTMIALGYPAEDPVMEEEQGSIKYYKDEEGRLHVPKRKMEDVVFYK